MDNIADNLRDRNAMAEAVAYMKGGAYCENDNIDHVFDCPQVMDNFLPIALVALADNVLATEGLVLCRYVMNLCSYY